MLLFFLQDLNAPAKVIENAWLIQDVMLRSLNSILSSIFGRLPYILAGLLVFGLFWLLSKIVKTIFWKASEKTKLDGRLRILVSRLLVVFIYVLGIFTAFTIIIPTFRFGDLIAGLGFTSFVIGFATKDILNNLLSGVLILWQQPFKIGDYIFVGSNQGKVEYIGVRATQLRKDDGELILIPNGDMYSSALTIRGAGAERRMVLKFSIGYNSEVGQAKSIIHRVLDKIVGVVEEPQPSVVVTDLSSNGVDLSVYFWVNTDKYKPLKVFDAVASEIKKALCDAGIEIFPSSPPAIVQIPEKAETANEITAAGKRKKDDF